MKILLMTEGCHPETQGGIQTFSRILKKIFDDDMTILGDATKNIKVFKIKNMIEIKEMNICFKIINKLLKNFLKKRKIKNIIEIINPDVFVLNFPYSLETISKINKKKILVQHTSFDFYFERYYKKNYKLLEKSKKELDYFVVLSPQDKIKLIQNLGFPERKIVVIRHSCELEKRKTKKEKSKNLIMIARLVESKRFDLAIQAMKDLPDFTLKIYGSGEEQEKLKNMVNNMGIINIKFCGVTSKIKEILDENGIFIMTSDYEGYPMTVIEAMRRGLPIVLRNTFASASDIIDGNGILLEKKWDKYKFCEAIYKIYENYEEYSSNSVKLASKYDIEVITKKWKSLILKLSMNN